MKELQERNARKEAMRREAEILAAELDLNQGYVLPSHSFFENTNRKVNEWMAGFNQVYTGQVRSAMSEPGGVRSPGLPLTQVAEITGLQRILQQTTQTTKDHHSTTIKTGIPRQLTTVTQHCALPAQFSHNNRCEFDFLEPWHLNGGDNQHAKNTVGFDNVAKMPKLSHLEQVANADKTDLYYRNLARNQMQNRGYWAQNAGVAAQETAAQRQPRTAPVLQAPRDALPAQMGQGQLQEIENQFEGESTITHRTKLQTGCCKHDSKKLRSGFLDKPDTDVHMKVLVPHMAQNRCFVHRPTTFEKLTFECFVAGEARIIEKCSDPIEMLGRLRLLQRVCYWRAGGAQWTKVRSMYQAILRMIEDQEMPWLLPLYQFDPLMNIDYDLIINPNKEFPKKPKWKRNDSEVNDNWFCKDFNRSECAEHPPHPVMFKGIEKMAHHICARCWKEKRERQHHPESSSECPFKN